MSVYFSHVTSSFWTVLPCPSDKHSSYFQLQFIHPWLLWRLFWYLTLTQDLSDLSYPLTIFLLYSTHTSFCCIYSLSYLSLSHTQVTVGIPLHHFYDWASVRLRWWLIHRLFIKHFMSTEDPCSSEKAWALKTSFSQLQSWLCPGGCLLLSEFAAHSLSSLIK